MWSLSASVAALALLVLAAPREARAQAGNSVRFEVRLTPDTAASGQRAPTLAELQEFLERQGVAKYMWPESIEVFDEFPRTPSLKVVKRQVVKQIVARAYEPAGV